MSYMDDDSILHFSAQDLFCCILEHNPKQAVDIMTNTIAMGPQPSLRLMGELGNTIDQFKMYLLHCAKFGISNPSTVQSILDRFCSSLKKGEHMIKMGNWDDEDA